MKKVYYLVTMLLFLLISSCQEEKVYSCDPTVDKWVKNNLDDIQIMNRSSWKTLPEDLKGATFGAFTAKQKISFWEEKLTDVLTLDWNTEEREHIQKLYVMVKNHPEWFDISNRTEAIEDEMAIAAYEWIKYAKETLQWDSKTLGAIVASGNDLVNKSGLLKISTNTYKQQISTRSEDSSCNCNQTYDFCSGVEDKCKDKTCKEVDYCGWLLLSKCNGLCGMS